MEDKRSNGAPRDDCGEGGSDRSGAPCGTSESCGCRAVQAGGSRAKTLIAAIVIISAIAVGAYSLMAGRTDPPEQTVGCGAAGGTGEGKATGHSCCASANAGGKTAAACAAKADSAACRVPSGKK